MIEHNQAMPAIVEDWHERSKGTLLCNGVVAGGAPRDWLLDKPISDIDIFVQSTANYKYILSALKMMYPNTDVTFLGDESYAGAYMWVFCIDTLIPINVIIHTDTFSERVSKFPCALSQIWFTRSASGVHYLYYTDAFASDYESNTITFSGICSTPYAVKIRKKYMERDVQFTGAPQ